MKKQFILLSSLMTGFAFAQVGINTELPKATLDVVSSPADLTKTDGFIAPRLKGSELKAKDGNYDVPQTGAIVYITEALATANTTAKTVNVTTLGYFYFDGSIWQKMTGGISGTTNPWNLESTTIAATLNTQNIYQNGNVGIGDFSATNPIAKLDVRGAIRGGTPNLTAVVGNNSLATGINNTAGESSAVFGKDNVDNGVENLISGRNNNISLYSSLNAVFGYGSLITSAGGSVQSFDNVGNITAGEGHIITNSIGHSAMFGNSNTDLGGNALMSGNSNSIGTNSHNSVVLGQQHKLKANSSYSFLVGYINEIDNSWQATAIGANIVLNNAGGTQAMGNFLKGSNLKETLLGNYNAVTTDNNTLFQLGKGTTEATRENAITVSENGNTAIGVVGLNATALATEKLDIGSGNVRIRDINTVSGAVNDNIVVADATGVLKTVLRSTFDADVRLIGTNHISQDAGNGSNGTSLGTGLNNIAIGKDALMSNTTGIQNIAIGVSALKSNTTGRGNLVISNSDGSFESSGASNTTGNYNLVLGGDSFTANTSGEYNIAMGAGALFENTVGNYNTAIGGMWTMGQNKTGLMNTALGTEALTNMTVGVGNTAIGVMSLPNFLGDNNTNSVGNIGLGYNSGNNLKSGKNNILIGLNAEAKVSPTGSNQLNIGNWIYGDNGKIGLGNATIPTNQFHISGVINPVRLEGLQPTSTATTDRIIVADTTGVLKTVTTASLSATDFNFSTLPTYADDVAAGAGSVASGKLYKTATGEIRIKL